MWWTPRSEQPGGCPQVEGFLACHALGHALTKESHPPWCLSSQSWCSGPGVVLGRDPRLWLTLSLIPPILDSAGFCFACRVKSVLSASPALTFSRRWMQCGGCPRLAVVSDGKGDPDTSLLPSLSPGCIGCWINGVYRAIGGHHSFCKPLPLVTGRALVSGCSCLERLIWKLKP